MLGAYNVLNSDQAIVNNTYNQLTRIFVNLLIVKIKQLILSYLTIIIFEVYIIIDHSQNTNLFASTDKPYITSVCQSSRTSVDSRLANTDKTPVVFKSVFFANSITAAQVNGADTD
jgi:hypothetical protein